MPSDQHRLDRSVFTIGDMAAEPDERRYWHARTPIERLEAGELMRQMAYGYDPTTERLQRVFEVVECPWR